MEKFAALTVHLASLALRVLPTVTVETNSCNINSYYVRMSGSWVVSSWEYLKDLLEGL